MLFTWSEITSYVSLPFMTSGQYMPYANLLQKNKNFLSFIFTNYWIIFLIDTHMKPEVFKRFPYKNSLKK